MKSTLITFFTLTFFCLASSAQKIALIDKNFKEPIIYTDSLTVEQVKSGYFPVPVNNVDTFYANLKYLNEMLSIRQRSKMQSFELRAGNIVFKTSRLPYAYGDRYSIISESKVGELTASLTLSDGNISNSKVADKIEKMMKYIDSNKSLFRSPNEIHPKFYNVVVISDH